MADQHKKNVEYKDEDAEFIHPCDNGVSFLMPKNSFPSNEQKSEERTEKNSRDGQQRVNIVEAYLEDDAIKKNENDEKEYPQADQQISFYKFLYIRIFLRIQQHI